MKLKIRTLPILAAASILNFSVAAFSQALVTHRIPSALAVEAAMEATGGPGCLNRFSASISGASAGVRLPCGLAAG